MKITITGSLGHIGRPLTTGLVQKGHAGTVISSNPERQKKIEALGAKVIGEPELKWIVIPDEQMLNGMIDAGMNPQIAAGLVETNASTHAGALYEDYYLHRPTLGKVKLKDFAKKFAVVYNQ